MRKKVFKMAERIGNHCLLNYRKKQDIMIQFANSRDKFLKKIAGNSLI
jgi:hypothetical protein